MRVLLVHNRYQQPGGEDKAFMAESKLLEAYGHQVLEYTVHNDVVSKMSRPALAKAAIWNKAVYRELRNLIHKERPEVAHFHNTLPLISPAAYYAARAEGVPVVQTLHNYRLICPNALLFRDGRVCEDCIGKTLPWPGVVHACYRGDRQATGVVAGNLTIHRAWGTWAEMVDVYIALTNFAREKFVEGGLPADKILVKPNFVNPDPGMGKGRGGYALFVGRLSPEKGVDTLLSAWERLSGRVPLKIVGEGPLSDRVLEASRRLDGVDWLGRQSSEQVITLMKEAQMLILPSIWYESFPVVIAEAYAVGLPIVASNLGTMSSLIKADRTGLRFNPGDPDDLATQVEKALSCPSKLARMRRGARAEFVAKYMAKQNYQMLVNVYKKASENG